MRILRYAVYAVLGFVVALVTVLMTWTRVKAFIGRLFGKDNVVKVTAEPQIDHSGSGIEGSDNYNYECGWLAVKLNRTGLDRLIAEIDAAVNGLGESTSGKVQPHSHLDLYPDGGELTVALRDGTFLISDGHWISASKEYWQRYLKELKDVAANSKRCFVVLDQFDSTWCDNESTGRFSIEYTG